MEEVKNLEINKRAYSTGKIENFLDRLIRGKGSFVVRKGTEVNELIFKIGTLTNYTKSILGDLPETSIAKSEKELMKEREEAAMKATGGNE